MHRISPGTGIVGVIGDDRRAIRPIEITRHRGGGLWRQKGVGHRTPLIPDSLCKPLGDLFRPNASDLIMGEQNRRTSVSENPALTDTARMPGSSSSRWRGCKGRRFRAHRCALLSPCPAWADGCAGCGGGWCRALSLEARFNIPTGERSCQRRGALVLACG